MPDPSSSSTSSSSSSAPRNTSTFNQSQLEDLQFAEEVAGLVRTQPYATDLVEREITATQADALAARRRTAKAVREDTAGEVLTLQATGHERDLILVLQDIQAAAKQKYARRQPLRLQDYFVGERLNPNEATLHQNAFSIAELLTPQTGTDLATARDRLPGITLAKIDTLRDFIGLPPTGASSSSSSSSSSASGGLIPPDTVADRAERDLLIQQINDRRVEIQFAADGAYPYTDPLNAEARRAFHLPRSRPFTG
jgi:hypothetical protein